MTLIQAPPAPYTGQTQYEPDNAPWLGYPSPTGTTTTQQAPSTIDNILGIFDKVVEGIGKVGSTITSTVSGVGSTTQSTVTGIKNTIGDTASDVGSDSITKSLKENLPYIIVGLAAFTLIIVLAIYATKRK